MELIVSAFWCNCIYNCDERYKEIGGFTITQEIMDTKTTEILAGISDAEWEKYFHQLVLYAEYKCARWTWRTGDEENLPSGFSPESIATDAIRRFFAGKRTWNHDAYPDSSPVPFLKSVVSSIVSEIGHKEQHKKGVSLEAEMARNDADGAEFLSEPKAQIVPGINPERDSTPYEKIFFKQAHQRVLATLKDDPELRSLYELRADGLSQSEIAVRLDKTDQQIRALTRKFARKTGKIRTEIFHEIAEIEGTPEGGARASVNKRP